MHGLLRVRGGLQVQRHAELTAPVPLAGHGDGALHLIDDVFGDGHAQARTLGALHPVGVLPGKGLEDLLLEFLRYTDAGVLDHKTRTHEWYLFHH